MSNPEIETVNKPPTRETEPDVTWFWRDVLLRGIPQRPEQSVVKWAERWVRLPGSARSEAFRCDITPWLRVPIECVDDNVTRTLTFVKPVQSGGSTLGEIAVCRWTACWTNGDIQWNWTDNDKADERWKKRIERLLKATEPVSKKWPSKAVGERSKAVIGMVNFPHLNLICQGVFNPDNLDSDAIRGQVNEEIHNWEPGTLGKADRRQTAYWNSVQVNISNAGIDGDQLHSAFRAGTMEQYEVKCPGCGLYHVMRTKWEDERPDLGGLRYDADGCRLENGDYDYNKLAPTIRYQMPCGYEVRDVKETRRTMAAKGRWSQPQNKGANIENRSFTYDGIIVDYISFLSFVKEKHEALRYKKYGNLEYFKKYVQERECRFWKEDEAMDFQSIEVTTGVKKNRAGWPDADRAMTVDRQAGRSSRGESPHYWVIIQDWLANGDNLVVYEGMILTENELEQVRQEYNVPPPNVIIDTGWDTDNIYGLCVRHGYTAVKGDKPAFYVVEEKRGGKTRKIRQIWMKSESLIPVVVTMGGTRHVAKLALYLYSKNSLLDRLAWLEGDGAEHIRSVIPEDVSEDYKRHNQNMSKVLVGRDDDGLPKYDWRKIDAKGRNDLKMCRAYQVLFALMNGFISYEMEEKPTEERKE